MVKGDDGKMKIMPKQTTTGLDGWVPVCEKNLPYELTVSFLLLATNPGVPLPIKLQEQHKSIFPSGVHVTEESGRKVAAWAHGGAAPTPKPDADPLTQTELESFIEMLDVKTKVDLINAYNSALSVMKTRATTKEQFAKFKGWRDQMLESIEAGTI